MENRRVHVGDAMIDLDNRIVSRNGKEISLAPIEFDLSSLLINNEGQTISYHDILDKVWGIDYDGGSPEMVQAVVSRLRKKIGTKDAIETITGYGYRWNNHKTAR
ncbi:MAG: winged helix-turn-helix domain-containing protein [Peptococcaceae bacterium]|nr:winged helix-turn-helix domain-containing protein [Peptococcaceae bacterium]